MELVELIMAKTYEVKCACTNKAIVTCDEAGLTDACKRCDDCKTVPQPRVKLSVEDTYSWKKK
jgi:hypothetical protein